MKRALRICLGAAAISSLLVACQNAGPSSQKGQDPAAAAPDAKPGLSVEGARLVLPVVSGRPGVVYFTLRNGSDQTAILAGVHIEGAGTGELHETAGGAMKALGTVEIGAGQTVAFAQGAKHVMVFELSDELKDGGTTEMTLTFADGDKLSAPLAIEKMGNGGMTMGPGDDH